MLSSGANVIIWDELLSSGTKCYHLELMLSSGTKCYHLGLNVIIWDAMLSSGANVIIWFYHVMLLSWKITSNFFIFPGNFTHSSDIDTVFFLSLAFCFRFDIGIIQIQVQPYPTKKISAQSDPVSESL
jgi:hypothetical protein